MSAREVKNMARQLGADLCGIAPVDRFGNAPEGFRPTDIYHKAVSVIVYARRLPVDVLDAESCIPYTRINSLVAEEVDRLSLQLSLQLQDAGIPNIMIPSDDPFEYWKADRTYGRAILSLRHAAALAGLGRLGRNNLLINQQYGNMVQIGAILAAASFEYDDPATYEVCPPECRLCLDACPRHALDGTTVDQKACRPLATYRHPKGYILKKCWECRKVCPHARGVRGMEG